MSVLLWSPPIVLFLTSGLFGSEQLNAIMQDDRMFQVLPFSPSLFALY
jgi:hypothetical protein